MTILARKAASYLGCKLISLLLVFEGSTDLGIVSNILKLMKVSEGGSLSVDSTSTAVLGLLYCLTLEINSVQQKVAES